MSHTRLNDQLAELRPESAELTEYARHVLNEAARNPHAAPLSFRQWQQLRARVRGEARHA